MDWTNAFAQSPTNLFQIPSMMWIICWCSSRRICAMHAKTEQKIYPRKWSVGYNRFCRVWRHVVIHCRHVFEEKTLDQWIVACGSACTSTGNPQPELRTENSNFFRWHHPRRRVSQLRVCSCNQTIWVGRPLSKDPRLKWLNGRPLSHF